MPSQTVHSKFPYAPDLTDYAGLLEGPIDSLDHYGIMITGYLIPQESASYDFYLSSNEAGQFLLNLSPGDDFPSHLTLLCLEPLYNAPRDWTGVIRRNPAAPENRSTRLFPAGIQLQAGQRYLYRALMKESTGGDNLAVAVAKHGQTPPTPGSSPITAGFSLAVLADPAGASVTTTASPQDTSVEENHPAIFSVTASGATVSQPNHPPSFWLAQDLITSVEDAGEVRLSGQLAGLSPGPAHESGQAVAFTLSTPSITARMPSPTVRKTWAEPQPSHVRSPSTSVR